MAIAASGAVSFSDLRTEFVGGSSAISYSDLYRGGSNIRAKAANNNATNLAASVPTSGTINFTNFRSQAKGFKYTYAATSTDQDADTLFGSDYAVNYPKIIEIPSGVTIGGVSDDALDIPAGLAGSLVINNSGSIIGKGGAANGGAGGNAISCAASGVTFNNLSGAILAGGGGGGGQGGQGGNGTYTSTSSTTSFSTSSGTCGNYINGWHRPGNSSNERVYWGGTEMASQPFNYSTSMTGSDGATYYRGSYQGMCGGTDDVPTYYPYSVTRTTSSTASSTGASGGAGGVGRGYSQSLTSGSAGATGSNNAGNGGAGGAGGDYGNAGNTGSTGANGNATSGLAGSGGGAAGAAVTGTSITINNSGNVYGATA